MDKIEECYEIKLYPTPEDSKPELVVDTTAERNFDWRHNKKRLDNKTYIMKQLTRKTKW